MLKSVLKIILFFVVGFVGGIFADQIFWPYFIERPLFYEYRLEKNPIYVTEKKIIQENIALQDAFSKSEKVVVGIKTIIKGATTQTFEGSGIVLTSDGLAVTLADFVPQGTSIYTCFINGDQHSFQVLKIDKRQNLALIKIDAQNLTVAGFVDPNSIRQGQRVFLIGTFFEKGTLRKIVNEGMIKIFDSMSIQTNIVEKKNIQGGPLLDISGNVAGLVIIDKEGKVSAMPASRLRDFAGL